MFLSLLAGTLVYILAQVVWYSPFGFGPRWTQYQKTIASEKYSEKDAEQSVFLTLPEYIPLPLRAILLPAFAISLSLHVFRVMLPGLSGTILLFVVLMIWFSVAMGKYFRKNLDVTQRRKWRIEDGAVLWSLLWVVEVVILR